MTSGVSEGITSTRDNVETYAEDRIRGWRVRHKVTMISKCHIKDPV